MSDSNEVSIPRPFLVKAINAIGHVCQALGVPFSKLDEDKYLRKAQQQTGLSDFGDPHFREGLTVLLESLKHDAKLNPMGLIVADNQITQCLANRLKVLAFAQSHPSIQQQPISKPIFVAGLPRTGTTILHSLLSQDPRGHGPLSWETLFPLPPDSGPDKRIQQTDQQLDRFCKIIPGFEAIHPVGAELPTECITIHAMDFTSLQFMVNFDIPRYREWYLEQDFRATMRFHKTFLQVLDYFQPTQHWVLKTPGYFATLDAIFEVYPDACIIQTHRDPMQISASLASLFYSNQQLCSDSVSPTEVAQKEIAFWGKVIGKGMDQRDAMPERAAQFYDVYFDDLMAAPFKTIEGIYQHFDMEFSDTARHSMQRFLTDNGREKHGKHHYTAAMYGINQSDVDNAFGGYYERYFGSNIHRGAA